MRVHGVLDLESHRRAESSTHQLALEGLQQVLGVVFLDFEVFIARDPEGVLLQYLHAGEEIVQVSGDDVFERDEARATDVEEPRQHRRHLHAGKQLAPGVWVAHHHGEIQRQARDVGERVRWIDREGRQHREDLVEEDTSELLALGVAQLAPPHYLDALLDQPGQNLAVEALGMPQHHLVRMGQRDVVHLARQFPARGPGGDPGSDASFEPGDTDHKELVEIAGEDGEELGPLEQRKLVVLSELEHSGIEGQPR
ncbi:unannotated protein [freshwater metagenome]|uniref:Unannotated protein n=1 Tax=freshwater metagenome TaxID=449393 RepID=A0A6J7NP05_9ZZZZ